MPKIRMLAMIVMAALVAGGCSTMQDAVREHDEGGGTSATYAVSMDQAWKISKAVFRWEGCDAIEEHRDDGYMLTSSGQNMVSWGAVMGAWLTPVGNGATEVTVVTKRRLSMNVATTLTEGTFHKRFREAIEIVKSGEPLPAASP